MINFPDPKNAPHNAPLGVGGNLEANTLILAYRQGIFPWFLPNEPILWWSPDPRAVIFPQDIKIHKSIKPFLKHYEVRFDTDFSALIRLCKRVREAKEPTWLSDEILAAYTNLHTLGYAHSVQTYENNELIGGLYGVMIGKVFCGESMISLKKNASKVALIALCTVLQKYDFLIDAQVMNEHLKFMGAKNLPRNEFLDILEQKKDEKPNFLSFRELKFKI